VSNTAARLRPRERCQLTESKPGNRSLLVDEFLRKRYFAPESSYKNGVGYGKWTHIDGWSESVVEYVRTLEWTSN
jgi:hypothetical protein